MKKIFNQFAFCTKILKFAHIKVTIYGNDY